MGATEGATEFESKALARIAAWHAKADDLMRCAKAYNCRSQEAVRTGYIKQAAQARMCAEELERDYAESRPSETPMVEVSQLPEAPEWSSATDEERSDQGSGQLDVPGLQTDHP